MRLSLYYRDMLDFIAEVGSPALKACRDSPLMECHSEQYYQQAVRDTGPLLVHTHIGGRFEQRAGEVHRLPPYEADD